MITAPVSRSLAVADLGRSTEFYRKLGFEPAAGNELVSGPASILLRMGESAPDSTFHERPRGHATVFLEVDDLHALHRRLAAEGLTPGSIERVNWIKYRMFDVRDPDGHVIWFAQTYQEPDRDNGEPELRQIMPEFPLDDVPRGVEYYVRVLGFTINYAQDDLGVMDRDKARILLVLRSPRRQGPAGCCVYIRDADALHAELQNRGAEVLGPPVSHPWGLRDFTVRDLEGNEITFAQTFE